MIADAIYESVKGYPFISLAEVTHFSKTSSDIYFDVFKRLVNDKLINCVCIESITNAKANKINQYILGKNIKLQTDDVGIGGVRYPEYLKNNYLTTQNYIKYVGIEPKDIDIEYPDRMLHMKKIVNNMLINHNKVLYIGYHFNKKEIDIKGGISIGMAAKIILHPLIYISDPRKTLVENDTEVARQQFWLRPWNTQIVRTPPTLFECNNSGLVKPMRGDKIRNYGLIAMTPYDPTKHHRKYRADLINAMQYDYIAIVPISIPLHYDNHPPVFNRMSIIMTADKCANLFTNRDHAISYIVQYQYIDYIDIEILKPIIRSKSREFTDSTIHSLEVNPPVLLKNNGIYLILDGDAQLYGISYQITQGRDYMNPVKCHIIEL